MGFINWLKKKNREEQFSPHLLGLIVNPYYFDRRAIYSGIKTHAHKLHGKLLDFGCGEKNYEHLFHVDTYTGIDIEGNKGHSNPLDKVDVFYNGRNIPFPEDAFDSIFSSEVFEHVFNLEEILSEINRVHKKNGLLLITMPFAWREHEMPNDFGRYTSAGISDLLKRHHYEILEHKKAPGHFLSIVQLFNAYLYHNLLPGSRKLKFFLCPFTVFPVNLLGLFFGIFLPKSTDLFINHTILARNIK